MNDWGHRGISLAMISSGGIVLLGAEIFPTTLSTILTLYLCLCLGVATANLPNTLESLTGLQRRGFLHSILAPIGFIPVIYLVILGVGAQLQQAFAQAFLVPPPWDVFAALIAGTAGAMWLLHIAVDSGTQSRGQLALQPFFPLSDRIVSGDLYQNNSRLVNWCAFIVGSVMTILLSIILVLQLMLKQV